MLNINQACNYYMPYIIFYLCIIDKRRARRLVNGHSLSASLKSIVCLENMFRKHVCLENMFV